MDNEMPFRLLAFDARHITPYGIGYAADSIALGMNNSIFNCCILSYFNELGYDNLHRTPLLKSVFLHKVVQKFMSKKHLHQLAILKMNIQLNKYDGVYFWTNCGLKLYQQARQKNKLIVHEAINTHQNSARTILADEYQRLELKYIGINDAGISNENQKLALADYVFCPSPNVTKSMIKNGVDPQKLVETSYGLGEHQRHIPRMISQKNGNLNALFVGSGIIRKGIHLLLEYWRDSDLNGKLVVVGSIDPLIEHLIKPYRKNPRFEFINFTPNIDEYFKNADVFVLPSLEEGSPLVTYLAIGAGLPCVVSPMGGEGVIRDGIDGFIIDPHDKSAWVSTLTSLANEPERRLEMSQAAYERSEYFLWHNVGQRRAKALIKRIGDR